jgi:hypothetical protein
MARLFQEAGINFRRAEAVLREKLRAVLLSGRARVLRYHAPAGILDEGHLARTGQLLNSFPVAVVGVRGRAERLPRVGGSHPVLRVVGADGARLGSEVACLVV